MKKHIFNDFEKAIIFGLIFSVVLSVSRFDASCEDMRQNILRIHIIANSNSRKDQEVKLKVRDAILENTKDIFGYCESKEIAIAGAKQNLNDFEDIANKVIRESGFSYNATAIIEKSYFNTRDYKDFSLPAGCYDSLTVKLGKAEGKNFWCVIYPSVCIGGSSADLTKSISSPSAEIAKNKSKYIMKFKTIEIYEKLKSKKKRSSK